MAAVAFPLAEIEFMWQTPQAAAPSSWVQVVVDRAATTIPPLVAPPQSLLLQAGMMEQEDTTKDKGQGNLPNNKNKRSIKLC